MCKPSSQANSFLKPMKDPFGPHTRKFSFLKGLDMPLAQSMSNMGLLSRARALFGRWGMEAVTTDATWIKAIVLASLGCSSAWQTSSGGLAQHLQIQTSNRAFSSFKAPGLWQCGSSFYKALALTALTEQTHDTHRLHGLHGLQPCT